MKIYIVFLLIVMMPFCASAQVETDVLSENIDSPKEEETIVYDEVDQEPSFPGGESALASWLASNLRYPPIAQEEGIQGLVVCSFIVERDGSFTNVRVVKNVYPSLDNAAVNLIKKMPHWIPGKKNGAIVRAKCNLPISFSLCE